MWWRRRRGRSGRRRWRRRRSTLDADGGADGDAPGPNFVKGAAGVVQIPSNAANAFSSSMLGASTDGTFVIQSADAPETPSGATPTLTEYTVTASESAAGVTSSTSKARIASTAGREGTNAVLPFRQRLDPRTGALQLFHGRSTMSVVGGGGRSVQSVRRVSSLAVGTVRTFHIQQGTITGVGGTCSGAADHGRNVLLHR